MVYVDPLFTCQSREPQARRVGARHGHRWLHMWADKPEELHSMARKLGLRREWFQNHPHLPHYDLVPTKRAAALALGATEMDARAWRAANSNSRL